MSLISLLRLAGPSWVLRLAIRKLRREWRRLTAPTVPGPYPPARKGPFAGENPRFFVDQTECQTRAALVENLLPAARERTLAAAESVLAHRFDLLGSGPTDLGPEIDWHADFKTGYRWPLAHHLRPSGPPSGNDVKVPWELSRCHHFLTLGRAYAFTHDERCAREFAAQINAWLAANPPGFSVNWLSPMEAAIRAVNWIWAYHFFAGAEALTPAFRDAFLAVMDAHGRYIVRNLETYWPPTNHLIANYAGLVYLGVMFPHLRESRRWLRRGRRGLLRALRTQVYADGFADEASTSYHRLVTELFLSPMLLLQLNGDPLPEWALARLEKMLEAILAFTRSDGLDPLIGDADDGRLHPLDDSGPNDPGYLLAMGATLFERPDLAAGVGNQWEEALWLFGEQAAQVMAQSKVSEAQPQSTLLPDAGLAVMHHGDRYLSLDAGPHGHRGNGGHAHNDTLSITLSAHGRPFLIDPGTYAYTGDIEARNHFRSTAAHNTLQVDGHEINRFDDADPFRLHGDATPTIHLWKSTLEHDLLDASHDGYARLPGRVIHRRQVYFDRREGFWLLRDWVTGEGKHELAWVYHFAGVSPSPFKGEGERSAGGGGPGRKKRTGQVQTTQLTPDIEAPLHLEPGPEKAITATYEDGASLLILPLDPADTTLALSEDWVSPRYGVRHLAPLATYTRRAILPATFAVVLYPYQADQPPFDLARAAGERALAHLDDETSPL